MLGTPGGADIAFHVCVPNQRAHTLENDVCATRGCVGAGCTNTQETYSYNNRLQPVMIELGTSSSPSANYCLVYNYYSDVSNPTTCAVPTSGTKDSGNVMGYLYQDSINATFGQTATYGYDALNRLASASAIGSQTYNLSFSYD